MFKKILIANRGEIAARVIKTARRMGIRTVAVYCDIDRDAPYVEMADEAVNIGPPPAASSYLVIGKIVEACLDREAEAVHPGYGFLSERAAFAEALAKAGIAFIGPNPRAIAAMGDKIESKKLAAAARVSTIPGHLGVIDGPEMAVAVAREIGLPVMIKASAGGGGKGMRVARSEAEVAEGIAGARSEARSAFGDERVFIEKYIENPRHIEIQVLGDKHGHVIHLGERECSIQRRNQKIVEEAPSPLLDERTRLAMGEQAVALAKAVGYDSAGTVEFVVDPDRHFYFLEMNTRLQVEHPVTELVTGIDLVEQMIRVAVGEPLAIRQEDVRLNGSAIECRLYAEDPYRDFLPSIGRLNRYLTPEEGRHGDSTLRIDAGVVEGSEISIYFDPLIAKVITHGPDRHAAIGAMADALDRVVIDGIAHNQPFLAALMQSRRFREGRLSTAFIAEEYPQGFEGIKPAHEILRRLSIVAVVIESQRQGRFAHSTAEFVGTAKLRTDWVVAIADQWIPIAVQEQGSPGGALTIGVAGEPPVEVAPRWRPGSPLWYGSIAGEETVVQVRPAVAGVRLAWRGVEVTARVMTPKVAELDALMPVKKVAASAKALRCPMPGLVVAITVETGQSVRAGTPLAIVEAMKMENILRAERDVTIAEVKAKAGEILAVDAVIMTFA